eukprot:908144-Pyramimonas_sp.AAC.1
MCSQRGTYDSVHPTKPDDNLLVSLEHLFLSNWQPQALQARSPKPGVPRPRKITKKRWRRVATASPALTQRQSARAR